MSLLTDAQIISIDSLYYTYNDTVMFKHKNRYYLAKLWMSFNGGQQRLIYKTVGDKQSTLGFRRTYSPEIMKYVFNESDSIVYHIEYDHEYLWVRIVSLDGSSIYNSSFSIGTPEYSAWFENNYILVDRKILKYIADNLLKLKDIDAQIQNNILILRCYKYEKQLVVFQYDFVNKEWSIAEDRDLTEAEIDSLGFYTDEPKELNKYKRIQSHRRKRRIIK